MSNLVICTPYPKFCGW